MASTRTVIAEARNVELHHRPTDAPLPPAAGSVHEPDASAVAPSRGGRFTTGVPALVAQDRPRGGARATPMAVVSPRSRWPAPANDLADSWPGGIRERGCRLAHPTALPAHTRGTATPP